MKTVNWTPDLIEQMLSLHREGLSAALIGERIGVSKNSVCGKAHRLGLVLGRPEVMKPSSKPRGTRPPNTLKGKPRPPRNVLPAVSNGGGYRKPSIMPSGARQLAARRLAQATRAADRELIDAAVAAGRITRLPPGHAWGTHLGAWVHGLAS